MTIEVKVVMIKFQEFVMFLMVNQRLELTVEFLQYYQ